MYLCMCTVLCCILYIEHILSICLACPPFVVGSVGVHLWICLVDDMMTTISTNFKSLWVYFDQPTLYSLLEFIALSSSILLNCNYCYCCWSCLLSPFDALCIFTIINDNTFWAQLFAELFKPYRIDFSTELR